MKTLIRTLSIMCLVTMGVAAASAQEVTPNETRRRPQSGQGVGNSKVNTDFSKYRSFTWAKSDRTQVGPNGYDIYYYEFEPANKMDKTKMDKTDRVKQSPNSTTQEPYIYSYSVIIPAADQNADGVIKDAISNELEGRGYREDAGTGDLIVAYQVLDHKAQLHGYTNDDPTVVSSGQQVRQPSDTATFALEPGSLIISLIDAKTGEMVWDGFNNSMRKNDAYITDEVQLKEAVHNIFNEFKYSADKARRNK